MHIPKIWNLNIILFLIISAFEPVLNLKMFFPITSFFHSENRGAPARPLNEKKLVNLIFYIILTIYRRDEKMSRTWTSCNFKISDLSVLNSSVTGSVAMGVGSRLSSFSATLIILSRFFDTDDGKSILALKKSLIKNYPVANISNSGVDRRDSIPMESKYRPPI